MFPNQDQISVVAREHVESQLAMVSALTSKAFEHVEKLVDLNVNAVKASLQESTETVKQLLASKDPQEFFSLSAAQSQPTVEKAIAYNHHLASIASSTQTEFAKAAQVHIAEINRKVMRLVEDATNNAPVVSGNVVAMVKSVIDQASTGAEKVNKTAKKPVDVIEPVEFEEVVEKPVSAKK